MFWTNDDLVSQVLLKSMAPANQATLTNQNVLDLASDELLALISPLINTYHSGFYEVRETTSLANAAQGIPIPYRALMSRVMDIILVDQVGNEWTVPVVSYSEDMARPQWNLSTNNPVCYIRNDRIFFNPATPTGSSLYIVYYMRPSRLIPTTEARQVVAVNPGSINISSALPGLSTGTPFDVTDKNPIRSLKKYDQTATVAGVTLTFSGANTLAVGDWVSLANSTPLPQIPYEMFPVLTQRTAARVMDILGDRSGAELLRRSADEFLASSSNILAPRAANHPRFIVNTTGPGKYRGYYSRYRRGY